MFLSPFKRKLLFFVFIFFYFQSFSQFDVTYGVKAEFGFSGVGESFVFISGTIGIERELFLGKTISKSDFELWVGKSISPAFQGSFNIYYNGLGDNIVDKFKTVNIDFVTSMMVTVGLDNRIRKQRGFSFINIQPFHSLQATAIPDPFKSSFSLGTNFLFNSRNRNQRNGFFNLNLARTIVIGYYNDGPPFDWIPFGDKFDRYWTGGGFLELYPSGLNRQENPSYVLDSKIGYYHDRFTGDVQDAYNTSNFFGFDYVFAKDLKENLYNRSRSKVGLYFFEDNYEFSVQKLGKLNVDVQDIIHNSLDMAKHINYEKSNWMIGVHYQNVFKN